MVCTHIIFKLHTYIAFMNVITVLYLLARPGTVESVKGGAIHSTKLSGNFGPKLNGSVRSNRKSFEKTGPPFEVDHFSRSDRLEFWLNGSRPETPVMTVINDRVPVSILGRLFAFCRVFKYSLGYRKTKTCLLLGHLCVYFAFLSGWYKIKLCDSLKLAKDALVYVQSTPDN